MSRYVSLIGNRPGSIRTNLITLLCVYVCVSAALQFSDAIGRSCSAAKYFPTTRLHYTGRSCNYCMCYPQRALIGLWCPCSYIFGNGESTGKLTLINDSLALNLKNKKYAQSAGPALSPSVKYAVVKIRSKIHSLWLDYW